MLRQSVFIGLIYSILETDDPSGQTLGKEKIVCLIIHLCILVLSVYTIHLCILRQNDRSYLPKKSYIIFKYIQNFPELEIAAPVPCIPWIPEPSRRFNLLFTVEGSGIQGMPCM
jgi:hypothetical protein